MLPTTSAQFRHLYQDFSRLGEEAWQNLAKFSASGFGACTAHATAEEAWCRCGDELQLHRRLILEAIKEELGRGPEIDDSRFKMRLYYESPLFARSVDLVSGRRVIGRPRVNELSPCLQRREATEREARRATWLLPFQDAREAEMRQHASSRQYRTHKERQSFLEESCSSALSGMSFIPIARRKALLAFAKAVDVDIQLRILFNTENLQDMLSVESGELGLAMVFASRHEPIVCYPSGANSAPFQIMKLIPYFDWAHKRFRTSREFEVIVKAQIWLAAEACDEIIQAYLRGTSAGDG